jgi:MazG family protein
MSINELSRIIEIINKLHDPQKGCPWDLKQTHKTLLPYLIEESYEFIDAVDSGDIKLMEEEIGDVLLQVLHHCTMAEKNKEFNIYSVCKKLSDKMIRRHPHVFGDNPQSLTPEEVTHRWQELKASEKSKNDDFQMSFKLTHFPALESAYRIGKKSTTVNFDWSDYYQVMSKIEEEWQEVKTELPPGGNFNKSRVQEEIGDLLFSVAQLARHLDLNPEECLKEANKKFIRRFQKVETKLKNQKIDIDKTSQEELEKIWTDVKNEERN